MLTRLRRWPPLRSALRSALRGARTVAGPVACLPAAAQALLVWRARPPLDREWYAAQGFSGARWPVAHYLLTGRRAGWSLHPVLEPTWVAPTSWRRPWPEPLAAVPAGRTTHPALAVPLTPGAARALTPDTALPMALGAPAPYDVLRQAILAAARERREQEELRLLPRVRSHFAPPAPQLAAPPELAALGRLPSVSVVMPVRDRPAQVAQAIASVQGQTHRQWQLVVVDDGSSDATPDVVAELARSDPRIELLRAEHGGVSSARNLGAARATGEVLTWLDSDNTWTPDYLRVMLATLATTGAQSAYAALEQRTGDGVRYRALDAGAAALALQNHIDLNVLAARREAVEAVGGFDPTLRRAVDYDLVLRLAQRSPPLFVPFVGARYDARREAADRVTVREAKTWSDVVRARRLVDWAALDDGAPARVADRLSVVLPLDKRAPPARFVPTVLDAVRQADGDVEVVVVDAGGARATGTALAGLAASCERIRVLRWPAPMTPGWALAHALPHTSGAMIAVPDAGSRLEPGYDRALARQLASAAVVTRPHLLAVRAGELVAARGAEALDPTDGWRAELVTRIRCGEDGAKSPD